VHGLRKLPSDAAVRAAMCRARVPAAAAAAAGIVAADFDGDLQRRWRNPAAAHRPAAAAAPAVAASRAATWGLPVDRVVDHDWAVSPVVCAPFSGSFARGGADDLHLHYRNLFWLLRSPRLSLARVMAAARPMGQSGPALEEWAER
jgi:hypothetical protein